MSLAWACGVRRVGASPALAAAPSVAAVARRRETTGAHHRYEPGPVARAARRAIAAVTTDAARLRAARRLQSGLEQVEAMEKEAAWMRCHGSPLRVLGLPEHADLAEVRTRYRDLMFETHPDRRAGARALEADAAAAAEAAALPPPPTATPAATTATGATPAVAAVASAGPASTRRTPVPIRRPAIDEFALVREAFSLVSRPNSVFHQNGMSPLILAELQKGRRLPRATSLLAFLSYAFGLGCAAFFGLYLARLMWEAAVYLHDPEFFTGMVKKEQDEAKRRELGEVVDTDPKRLAPQSLQKLYYPGRFVHGDAAGGGAGAVAGVDAATMALTTKPFSEVWWK